MTTDYRAPDLEMVVGESGPAVMDPHISMEDELLAMPVVTPTHESGVSEALPGQLDGPGLAQVTTWSARLTQFARPSAYYALSRLAVLFAALAGKWLFPRLNPFKALTTGWDGSWYILIARHGYPHEIAGQHVAARWAFFPAYPMVIRATVATTGLSYSQATFVLSVVLGLTATLAIWLAVRQVFGPVIADRTVLLFVFFPASYVLSMAYTEGLFLTAAGACLYALSRRYWVTASLFAVLASLTRNFGLVLIACVVVAAVPVILRERKARPLVAIVIAPLGFLAWSIYSWATAGTPLAFLAAERAWNNAHFVWFLTPFFALFKVSTSIHSWDDGQVVLAAAAVLFAYFGLRYLSRVRDHGVSIPTFWWVFTIGSILGMLSPYEPVSVLRYSLAVIPLFAAYAWRMRPSWEGPVIGVLAFSQGVLVLMVLVGTLHPHTTMIWP